MVWTEFLALHFVIPEAFTELAIPCEGGLAEALFQIGTSFTFPFKVVTLATWGFVFLSGRMSLDTSQVLGER